jgi:hypothetical protein
MENFEAKLQEFIDFIQKMIDDYFANTYANIKPCKISIMRGKKYIRVVRTTDEGRGQRSVYCFIDTTDGSIYKSASWSAPAKHARGNIFVSLSDGVNPYGADYLR